MRKETSKAGTTPTEYLSREHCDFTLPLDTLMCHAISVQSLFTKMMLCKSTKNIIGRAVGRVRIAAPKWNKVLIYSKIGGQDCTS